MPPCDRVHGGGLSVGRIEVSMARLSKLVDRLPDLPYKLLRNLVFRLRKSPVRIVCSGNLLKVEDSGRFWWTHRGRLHLYASGLFHRGKLIGSSYLLNEITFENGDVIVDCGAKMGDLQL